MEIVVGYDLQLEPQRVVGHARRAVEGHVDEGVGLARLYGILWLQRLIFGALLKVGAVLGDYDLERAVEVLGLARGGNLHGNGGVIGKNIAECHLRIVPVRPKVGLYPRCTTTHIEIQTILALVVHQLLFATGKREESHGQHQY